MRGDERVPGVLFGARYCQTGRLSIPPQQRLRILLLPLLSSIHSERQQVEQLQYNLLCRWFVGLDLKAAG